MEEQLLGEASYAVQISPKNYLTNYFGAGFWFESHSKTKSALR